MNEDKRNLEQRIKDHFDVAVEKMQDNFDLLADGQKNLKENFQLMTDDMDEVKSNNVDMKIDIRILKEDVSVFKEDMSILKEDMKEIKSELKIKANKEIVENHEKRIIKLESAAPVR